MLNVLVAVVLAGVSIVAPSARAAGKIVVADDKTLEISVLLQPQLRFDNPAWNKKYNDDFGSGSWSYDPLIRRARLLMYGQFTSMVNFFVETDSPNFGYKSNYSTSMYIQDAYVELNLHPALQIDTGMLLLPFSHHGMQGAGSLLMVDYHSSLIKYPAGDGTATNTPTKVWRDVGVMVRGELLDKSLVYRLALTNGAQAIDRTTAAIPYYLNRKETPWVTGRVTYNLFDSEDGAGVGGMFWDGLYLKVDGDKLLSPKKIISLGASGSYQAKANYIKTTIPANPTATPPTTAVDKWTKTNFLAVAGDIFVDYPMGDGTQAVNAQVDFYYYDFGKVTNGMASDPAAPTVLDKDVNHASSGMGMFAEAGYRFGQLEPVVGVDWFDAKQGDKGDLLGVRGGVNYWIAGNTANVKAEFGMQRVIQDDNPDTDEKFGKTAIIQTQLWF